MRLALYLAAQRLTEEATFAAWIDVDRVTVSRWINGHAIQSRQTMEAIVRATEGAVTSADFRLRHRRRCAS